MGNSPSATLSASQYSKTTNIPTYKNHMYVPTSMCDNKYTLEENLRGYDNVLQEWTCVGEWKGSVATFFYKEGIPNIDNMMMYPRITFNCSYLDIKPKWTRSVHK